MQGTRHAGQVLRHQLGTMSQLLQCNQLHSCNPATVHTNTRNALSAARQQVQAGQLPVDLPLASLAFRCCSLLPLLIQQDSRQQVPLLQLSQGQQLWHGYRSIRTQARLRTRKYVGRNDSLAEEYAEDAQHSIAPPFEPPRGYQQQQQPRHWREQGQQQEQHTEYEHPRAHRQLQQQPRQWREQHQQHQQPRPWREQWQQQRQQQRQHFEYERSRGYRQHQQPRQWREQWQQQWQQQELQVEAGLWRPHSQHGPHHLPADSSSSSPSSSSPFSRTTAGRPGGPPGVQIDPVGLTQAISAVSTLQELQQLWKCHKDHMQQIHVCAAYKAVVRVSVGLSGQQQAAAAEGGSSSGAPLAGGTLALELMRQLGSRMQQQIRVARPWDLAQAAWACSKLHFRDPALLEAIAQHVQRKAAVLLPQDIAQLASAYARLGYQHKQLMALLEQQAVAKAADFKPWSLVHTAWALDSCGQDVQQLMQVVVQQLGRQPGALEQLNALDVSTLLWLMAGHKVFDQQLLDAAAALLAQRISSYPPTAASQSLLACAALGFTTPALTAAASAAVVQALQEQRYRPPHVAASTFALAKLQACNDDVMSAAAAAFLRQPSSYAPGLLSMLCWAYVLAGQQVQGPFWEQLLQLSQQKLSEFAPDQLASVVQGILASPGWQGQHTAVSVLGGAQQLLPQKCQGMSTPVLSQFIRSASREHKLLHRQQPMQQQQHQQAAGQPEAQLDTGSGTSGNGSQQNHKHLHQLLCGMLESCVSEWLKPARRQAITQQQATAVSGALAACQEAQWAAAAQQVLEQLQAAGEPTAQVAPASAAVMAGRAGMQPSYSSGASVGGTWVDSFVAGS